jgi:GNAT superfamily N-acetyltransferase
MNLGILEPTSEEEAELNAFLDARIYEFNVQETGLGDGRPFSAVVKDENDNIVAATSGHTWGGCCHIVHLWVHESKRRRGIGRALLQSVEKEAAQRLHAVARLYSQFPSADFLRTARIRAAGFGFRLPARSCTVRVRQASRCQLSPSRTLELALEASAEAVGCLFPA